MAIRVEEKYAERSATRNQEEISDYTRVYNVISDTALSESQVLIATDTTTDFQIADINSSHYTDSRAKCVNVSASPKDSDRKTWEVTVKWQTMKGSGSYDDEDENTTDPTTQRPKVSFGSTQYTKVVDKYYGAGEAQGSPAQPIQNSAGEPFDPPVQLEFSRTIIEISYNTRIFETNWMREFENTVNEKAETVGGMNIPAGEGRITTLDADPLYDDNDELYWNVNAQIELNDDGYILKLLDQGFNYLDNDDLTEFTVKDKDGNDVPASEPQKLNGTGGKWADESPAIDPQYLEFEIYFSKDWKSLNLPASY